MVSPVVAEHRVGYGLLRGFHALVDGVVHGLFHGLVDELASTDDPAGDDMSNSRIIPSDTSDSPTGSAEPLASSVADEAPDRALQLMAECHEKARPILALWFVELTARDWFRKSDALDGQLRERFADLLEQALACELWEWRGTPGGRLAEILVLDQFSRNMHRETPRAFAGDTLALALSQQAVAAGDLERLPVAWQPFLIMPWMHSESARIHAEAERLFDRPGLEENLRYERLHADIIRRFGRYPHRNAALGRDTTPQEAVFLQQPGSSF